MKRMFAGLLATALLAAGCGGDADAPDLSSAADAPAAPAAPTTTAPRSEPTPQPSEPAPVAEPEPEPEIKSPPGPADTTLTETAWERDQINTAAVETVNLIAQGLENDEQIAGAEPAAEESEQAPLPTAPPPPEGPQPSPDDDDIAPDIEDASAETTDMWHLLGDKVILTELLTRNDRGIYCGLAHSGEEQCPALELLHNWCVYGNPPQPWRPGEWIVDISRGHLAVIYNYYRIVGVDEWPTDTWPREYTAKVVHYRTIHPPDIDPLPPVTLPDEDNLAGEYENMGTPNPYRLIEIDNGLYAADAHRAGPGEEVRCGG